MRYEFAIEMTPLWHRPPVKPDSIKRVPRLRRMLVLAYQIAEYMEVNKVSSMSEFCRSIHITPARGSQIINLLYLSPRIQEDILLSDDLKLRKIHEWIIRPLFKEVYWPHQEDKWREFRA